MAPQLDPTLLPAPALDVERFRTLLAAWYTVHARTLPWRGVQDPYATWLSEIMLQQTRVATVIERYKDFLKRYPTLKALAAAQEDDVLALWSGMGYYRRARMLLRGVQLVMSELDGVMPQTAAELRTLPGVGEYTAAAIASIAFGQSVAVVDGNVERVLLRVLGRPEDRSTKARAAIAKTAQSLVPPALAAEDGVPKPKSKGRRKNPPGDHNQAMMELGATICLPRAPLCLQCPVVSLCRTRGEHCTVSRLPMQSVTVAHVMALRKRGVRTEVLLERRAATASLMPAMLELPPIDLAVTAALEPVLRVRHAITNTNYYVQIFATSAPSAPLALADEGDELLLPPADNEPLTAPEAVLNAEDDELINEDEVTYQASAEELAALDTRGADLLQALQPRETLLWVDTAALGQHPLTGLTRKALQRLGVMLVPNVRLPAPKPATAPAAQAASVATAKPKAGARAANAVR